MKRFIIAGIVIIIVALCIIGYNQYSKGIKMTQYMPKDALIDFVFSYPKDWAVFERRGSYGAFIQAQIVETGIDVKKDLACNIIFTLYPASKVNFTPLTIQGLAEDIKKKRLLFKDSVLLSTSTIRFEKIEAIEDVFSYSIFKVPLQAGAKSFEIKEKIIIFKKGNNFYTLRLEAKAETFDSSNKIFERAIKSIKFR